MRTQAIALIVLIFVFLSPAYKVQAAAAIDSDNENTTKSVTDNTQPYANDAIKHYNRGSELHQAGFLNQAIVEYKAAIAADSRLADAYSNLGIIYATQHNYPRAKEAFLQALKLKPTRTSTLTTTLNGLGAVLYSQGQTDEAIDKWKEALAANPHFASPYYNMGNAYQSEKNWLQAKECFMKALTISPNMADAYFRLGNIMSKENHYPQAIVLLKKAVELDPEGEFVREARHSLYMMENHFEKSKLKNPGTRKNKSNDHS